MEHIEFIEYIEVVKDILPTFVTSLTVGIIGAYLGSIFTKKWTVQTQKKFYLNELKINKLQEISLDTSHLNREIASILGRMVSLEKGEITPVEFKIKQDQHQENHGRIYRRILVNLVFIEGKYSDKIKEIHETDFLDIGNMVYDRYHEEKEGRRYFPKEVTTFKNIEERIINCTLKYSSIIDDLNLKIKNELEDLKK
ncbi:hypothetical protein [Oceanobacillus jordanicus]|uniref:Uncharacterized protein n=1 Tax=Oceanobacillus jordanicus TaxID=2867266 RepID=A0AAW5BBK0_9BACI|nr:hypothetical protein [Oceanobacillus jordanicus]MCG3420394.1 hypothetical protein [Oceanobacillus jordanicus]